MNLAVEIAKLKLKNPVVTASGTFGVGREFADCFDLNQLGGITVKGVSNQQWLGNPPPRIAEVYGGMLNSVGLQNPGVDYFIRHEIPFLKQYDVVTIVNIAGRTVADYVEVADKLNDTAIDMVELNISCPNVKQGGVAFGIDAQAAEQVTKAVRAVTTKPLIVKLSPNVTDITEIAKAVESAGADGLSLINTLIGMRIDIRRRKPILSQQVGGLSGPAIKPVAIRMVSQVRQVTKLPIIGMGGIMTGEDAIEFMMAGANVVAVGTANLLNPRAPLDIINQMIAFCQANQITDINQIVGVALTNEKDILEREIQRKNGKL